MATTVDPKNKAKAPKAGFLTVVVDADEYEAALLDPLVHQTNLEATEFSSVSSAKAAVFSYCSSGIQRRSSSAPGPGPADSRKP